MSQNKVEGERPCRTRGRAHGDYLIPFPCNNSVIALWCDVVRMMHIGDVLMSEWVSEIWSLPSRVGYKKGWVLAPGEMIL